MRQQQDEVHGLKEPRAGVQHAVTTLPAQSRAAPLPMAAYADASEKTVSRKPLGSLTSNARLFHSVSCGSDLSVMPAFFTRFAISSTLPGVEMDKRTPIPFLRSRPFFQSSWFKPIWLLPPRSITPRSVPFSSHRSSIET